MRLLRSARNDVVYNSVVNAYQKTKKFTLCTL